MKDEIRKLFPLEFYINNKGEMTSEITLNTLNKLSDEIIKLQEENKYIKEENIRCINKINELEYYLNQEILDTKFNTLRKEYDTYMAHDRILFFNEIREFLGSDRDE